MSETLETITIGSEGDDSPELSLCPGHVSETIFRQAFLNEGWSDIEENPELKHEYWVQNGNSYYKTLPEDENAQPFTVMEW